MANKNKKHSAENTAWLSLRFTHLSLNSAGITTTSDQSTAVVEQQRIWQCSTPAAKSGIQAGMSSNHALMLNPTLILLERNPEQEARKLQELSYWAYRFTSQVSVYNDHTLLLEVGRSTILFNGLTHLLNLIDHDLDSFGVDTQTGLANTPKGAYLLSLNSRGTTPEAPERLLHDCAAHLLNTQIAHLDIEHKTISQLQGCGFEVLADLQSIPAAELGHRFGAEFLKYLDQILGRIADPQLTVTPPETFESSADFAEPISNLLWINQQLDRLLKNLAQFITTRALVCRSFTWRFFHENNRLLQTVTIGLSAKQNSFAIFRELTDLKLASIKLDWEFSSIELSSTQLVPKQLFNDDLFNPKPDLQQFNQLIDKLSNRLGHHALFRVHQAAEHLPELANDRQPALHESNAEYQLEPPPNHTFKDQPLWLLENPQRLAQQQDQPLFHGPLTIIHGPDRITSHWWSKLQSRDYFIARQRSGRLLWVFFDRGPKHWFLHGMFA